jgi:hypothetical protein
VTRFTEPEDPPSSSSSLWTEADVDARIVQPYLAAIGVQPNEVRAQYTFSVRLGRGMVHNVGNKSVRSGRLDYLILGSDGKPLFVIEEKGPNEELTDDDRDQGISYARLTHPMAPLVLVTNGRESRLYDTITKELLTSADSASLIRGKGCLTADEDMRVRAEALEHFVGYSTENIATFSSLQRENRMRMLRADAGKREGKYLPSAYVPREATRADLDAFLASDATVFALGGRSGLGKTNELCAWAESVGETHVTLFFSGIELFQTLSHTLTDEFNWSFSDSLPLPHICRRLARLADRTGKPVLIIVDAIDEAEVDAFPQELSDLANHLADFGAMIRLVVSAKPDEWERFSTRRGVPTRLQSLTFRPRHGHSGASGTTDALQDGRVSSTVGLFSEAECDNAIRAYTALFGLRGKWPARVRKAARDPFMLRAIAEVAADTGTVPADPGERELVRRYLDKKIERTAEPARARLELVAVARALTAREELRDERHAGELFDADDRARPTSSVSEDAVRQQAELPATAPIANELVNFGLLTRLSDADGRSRLAFSLDRVRDYMLATHAYSLPDLDRIAFRTRSKSCLTGALSAEALRWYLPYASSEQWAGFIDAASEQVQRMVDVYDRIRAHFAPDVRAHIDPRTSGEIGAAFCVDAHHVSVTLALFRRTPNSLPRVCFDESIAGGFESIHARGVVPVRAIANVQTRGGFWFLRAPERYAADHALTALHAVVNEGQLHESTDPGLLAERVVALADAERARLSLSRRTTRHYPSLGDRLFATDLYPVDLKDIRRRVQVELGVQAYVDAHMREREEVERRRLQAAGSRARYFSVASNWTGDDLRAWRAQAGREVDEGKNFGEEVRGEGELKLLASAVEALLEHQDHIARPLVPAPDVRDDRAGSGDEAFEDAYSDTQLARLVALLIERGEAAYERVVSASFSRALAERLALPPRQQRLVLCFRQARDVRWREQWGATITECEFDAVDGAVVPESKLLVIVVDPSRPRIMEPVGGSWAMRRVTTSDGQYLARFRQSYGLSSLVAAYDAPPFTRNTSGSAARHAPLRARVYELAREAVSKLNVEAVLAFASQSPEAHNAP